MARESTPHVFKLVERHERVAWSEQQRVVGPVALSGEHGALLAQLLDHLVGLARVDGFVVVPRIVVAAEGSPMSAHDLADGDELTNGLGGVASHRSARARRA